MGYPCESSKHRNSGASAVVVNYGQGLEYVSRLSLWYRATNTHQSTICRAHLTPFGPSIRNTTITLTITTDKNRTKANRQEFLPTAALGSAAAAPCRLHSYTLHLHMLSLSNYCLKQR